MSNHITYNHETDADNSESLFCPHCEEHNLYYSNGRIADDYCLYDFECRNCGATGIEYNQIVFVGYEYNTLQDIEDDLNEQIAEAEEIIRKAQQQIEEANKFLAKHKKN